LVFHSSTNTSLYCTVSEGPKTNFKQLTWGSCCEKFEDESRRYSQVYLDDS